MASELRLSQLNLSVTRYRGVWLRHGLETRFNRLLRLDAIAHETAIALNEDHVRLLERHGSEFRDRRVKSSCPGEVSSQDTFGFCGCTPEGVGKVFEQVAVSVFCSAAFAEVYTSKIPITACDLLYERVLPFYAEPGVEVGAVLTDNGREFCGRPEQHPYELLLVVEGIERQTTKVCSPRTNGFVERMKRKLLDECLCVKGRTTWYMVPEEIQRDLDVFIACYSEQRTHQGYRLKGRTPAQALR
ncbi:MAG: hypothetical protein RLZZ276_1398 [Pseudomonadota bacterium]